MSQVFGLKHLWLVQQNNYLLNLFYFLYSAYFLIKIFHSGWRAEIKLISTAKTTTKNGMLCENISFQPTTYKCGHSLSAFPNTSAGSTQTHDSHICDGCMPQCIRDPWAVYPNTSSHLYSHVKSMCLTSWTKDLDHIQWEHWEATGQEGSKRDMEMESRLGTCVHWRLSGYKAKAVQQWHSRIV